MKTAEIIPDRLQRIMDVPLLKGAHDQPPNGSAEVCVMEAVAYVAGEAHSDHPACVCEIIASFMRGWNDMLNDNDRNRLLKPLIPKLVNTVGNKALRDRRVWMVVDWLIREYTPPWLRLINLNTEADALATLAEINSVKRVESAARAIQLAKEKSAAAWAPAWAAAQAAAWAAAEAAARDAALDAAWAAAWDAARAAAWAAARAAAWDAARAAAWAAAEAAAWAAAWAAAEAAARDALRPTVEQLQQSAVRLIERMCDAK